MAGEAGDPGSMLASDAERETAVARLRHAGGEGRLTLEELSERVEAAYGARTGGELQRVVADLPGGGAVGPAEAPAGGGRRDTILSLIGGADRRGRWRVAPRITCVDLIGGSDLDLTEAVVESPDVEITCWTLIGGATIRVPEGVEVTMSGFALIGGNALRHEPASAPRAGAPRVHVRAYTLIGGTDVKGPRTRRSWHERARDHLS